MHRLLLISMRRNSVLSEADVAYTPDIELSRLLQRAARSANAAYRSRIRELGLTPRQAAAILALVERPGLTLNGLAEALGADQPTASSLIDRLLAAGYVRRETDPNDRRKASLQPTANAMQIAEALAAARHSTEELIRGSLGPQDSDELTRLLIRLVERLDMPSHAEERSP